MMERGAARLRRCVPLLAGAAMVGICVAALLDLHGSAAAFTLAAIAILAPALLIMAQRLRRRDDEVRRLAAVVESSGDAIISSDERGHFVSWSPSATALLGYTREEALGQSLVMIVPDDRREELMRIVETVRSGQSVFGWETVRQRKDGGLVEVEITVTPLRDARGRVTGAAAIMRDVRARNEAERRAARALAESEERFRRSFEDSGLGMALVLPDGYTDRLLEANEALAQITGYTTSELRALGPLRIIHSDDIAGLRQELRELGSGRISLVRREVRLVRSDGELVWVAMTVSLVRDAVRRAAARRRPDPGHERAQALRGAAAVPGRSRHAHRPVQPPPLRARSSSAR